MQSIKQIGVLFSMYLILATLPTILTNLEETHMCQHKLVNLLANNRLVAVVALVLAILSN
jgi:hypothetical protein